MHAVIRFPVHKQNGELIKTNSLNFSITTNYRAKAIILTIRSILEELVCHWLYVQRWAKKHP